jgi:hypothetical protein
MKPQSIRRFDLFYLGSIALSVIWFVLSYDGVVADMEARTAAAGVQLGAGLAIGSFLFGLAISLLVWFLASQKRLVVAKWIIVLLFVFSLFGLQGLFSGPWTIAKIVSLLSFILSAVAVFFLFTTDANAWFRGDAADSTENAVED